VQQAQKEKENGKVAPPKEASQKHTQAKKDAPSGKALPGTSTQTGTKKAPKDVSKEVLLILQEMNVNLNKQSSKIEKQDDRIEEIYNRLDTAPYEHYDESYNYDESAESYYENDQGTDGAAIEVESQASDTHPVGGEPPQKKQKAGVFSSLSQKFLQREDVDNEVNDDLANFVNQSFRAGISEEKQEELLKEIKRPSNCESLVKTRVNPGIWRLMKPYSQTEDGKMQKIQNMVVKAASSVSKLLDKHSDGFDSQDVEWGTNSLALLGQANKLINSRRKEMHKADLDPKYHYLASASLPFTDYLYGEDVDVNKNMKDINDMQRLGRNLGRGSPYFTPYTRGYRGRRPRRGGFTRFGGRGRGRADVLSAPKNPRQTYKKQ